MAYFITDNISIGLAAGISSSRSDGVFEVGDELRINSLSAGAFGRYYFTPKKRFSIFTELGVNYLTTKREYNGFAAFTETRTNGFGARFAPGINYFVSKSIALEASVGILSYATAKDDLPGANSTNAFNLNLDLSNVNFGVVLRF